MVEMEGTASAVPHSTRTHEGFGVRVRTGKESADLSAALPCNKCRVPHLARFSRDVGYHCARPESIRLTNNT